MTEFQIPQFIDIEDKVIGPFTVKQFLWLLAGGGILFPIWQSLPLGLFIMIGSPIAILFVGLAFYKVNGRSLIAFIGSMVGFVLSPRKMVFKHKAGGHRPVFTKQKPIIKPVVQRPSKTRLEDLAWRLDK